MSRADGDSAGCHVTLHVWRVPARRVGSALWRMARDRDRLRATSGVTFAKLLGTGHGRDFRIGSADLTRWAAILVWRNPHTSMSFDDTPAGRAWRTLATASCRIDMRPLASRGTWAKTAPFGRIGPIGTTDPTGAPSTMVLALTRARLKARTAPAFWRAIRPVGQSAAFAPGLLAMFGIGEAPIGWQGTVSVWQDIDHLVEFAYRHPPHRRAIDDTARRRWYAEELFARFAVSAIAGDRGVLDWTKGGTESL